jgi:hypothetical protein
VRRNGRRDLSIWEFSLTLAIPSMVQARAGYWAEKAARMPADGVVIAKEAFRLHDEHFDAPEPPRI